MVKTSNRFLEIVDEMWVEYKFAPIPVKIASTMIFGVGSVVLVATLWLLLSESLLATAIVAAVIGLCACLGIIMAYEPGQSDFRREENRRDKEHRTEHMRPVFHEDCQRCRFDRDYRTPRRYLGGR